MTGFSSLPIRFGTGWKPGPSIRKRTGTKSPDTRIADGKQVEKLGRLHWLARLLLMGAGLLASAGVGYRASLRKPNNPPMAKEIFEQRVAELSRSAKALNRKEGSREITSAEAVGLLMQQAAHDAGNEPEAFLRLLNEIFLDDKYQFEARLLGVPALTQERDSRFFFSDSGAHPSYRDYSPDQLSRHFWFFVNVGYFTRGPIGTMANAYHEMHAGKSSTSSIQDFRLGMLGLRLGNVLYHGDLTPVQLAEQLPEILQAEPKESVAERVMARFLPETPPKNR